MSTEVVNQADAVALFVKDLGKERRTSVRRKYVCLQLVADYDGRKMPAQKDFEAIIFQDISAGGVSFLSQMKPRRQQLVIALGRAPFSFWIVEVVFARRRDDLPGHTYQVGCRLLRRLKH